MCIKGFTPKNVFPAFNLFSKIEPSLDRQPLDLIILTLSPSHDFVSLACEIVNQPNLCHEMTKHVPVLLGNLTNRRSYDVVQTTSTWSYWCSKFTLPKLNRISSDLNKFVAHISHKTLKWWNKSTFLKTTDHHNDHVWHLYVKQIGLNFNNLRKQRLTCIRSIVWFTSITYLLTTLTDAIPVWTNSSKTTCNSPATLAICSTAFRTYLCANIERSIALIERWPLCMKPTTLTFTNWNFNTTANYPWPRI